MEKKFIKMNNNMNQLSLGNLIRIIKKNSINKHLASQYEIFCIIFDVEDVNESTINNYCIGARCIGDEYKNIYVNLKKKYSKNHSVFLSIVSQISCILMGNIYEKHSLNQINTNKRLKNVCTLLYNISKNDSKVSEDFSSKILKLINSDDLYSCIVELLFYVVLEHVQPFYVSDEINEKIENILYSTNISFDSLQEFLSTQFDDGINYSYSIRQLAKKDNPYALFELGLSEYFGKMTGTPRYNIAFEYFSKAASFNHPRANYIAGRMLVEGTIGHCTNTDIEKGLKYLKKAESLNNIACLNVLGQFYLKKGDENKALKYFERAASHNFVYAFNNLGKIYENKKIFDRAFEYYLKSANLDESWACNKIGEMYRLGIGTDINLNKAFEYYNKALNVPIDFLENYAKYNLAVYFYMYGNYEINIEKDEEKALKLLTESSEKVIESQMFLLCYYVSKKDEEKIEKYKSMIENNPQFNMDLKNQIEDLLKKAKKNPSLKIEI